MDTEDSEEAEREPLKFGLDLKQLDREYESLLTHIKELAENNLFHWKLFPFVLPPSITDSFENHVSDVSNVGVLSFSDLFQAPNFDELEEVARDLKGQPKLLTDRQLKDVREMGEFVVESTHFPGQFHKWRLTKLLQKGTVRAQNSLLDDLALALRLVIITASNRLYSHFFSASEGARQLCQGFWNLLDIIIGVPFTSPGDISDKVQQEHMRYLVAEFDVLPACKPEWNNFCDYVRETKEKDGENLKTCELKPPLVPYRYQTPNNCVIDLRIFNKDLLEKTFSVIRKILDTESKGWFYKFKDRLLTEWKDRNLAQADLVKEVNASICEEYHSRVFEAIRNNEELQALQPNIGKQLVEQAQAILLITRAIENTRTKLKSHRDQLKKHLMKSYPVRSRIQAWANKQLHMFQEAFMEQNKWNAHEEAIQLCREQNLHQAVYFLQRDLIFMRDREPVLNKELGKVRIPLRVFTWSMRIWLPNHWVIKRILGGEEEVIPTVIVDAPSAAPLRTSQNEPTFVVEKYEDHKTSTRYPFWRWINYIYRTLTWSFNAIFWLAIAIPWCSKVSIRALLLKDPFIPRLTLSKVNLKDPDDPSGYVTYGTLCPDHSSATPTLRSRLRVLWNHVRESRARFEEEPETGFLEKSVTRHINRFWNYGIKGALGSTLLVITFPLLCLLSCSVCLLAAVTTPLWMPPITLCVHLLSVVVYDFDHPKKSWNRVLYLLQTIIWHLLILGILQVVLAVVAAVIFFPLASAFVLAYALVMRGGRAFWDALMFHLIIKKRGRVPCQDGFIAKRIAGPGLASNYFYQVKPEQALAAAEAQMELHELNAWSQKLAGKIDLPLQHYRNFVRTCFGPFSAKLSEEGVYQELLNEAKKLHYSLEETVGMRKKKKVPTATLR